MKQRPLNKSQLWGCHSSLDLSIAFSLLSPKSIAFARKGTQFEYNSR